MTDILTFKFISISKFYFYYFSPLVLVFLVHPKTGKYLLFSILWVLYSTNEMQDNSTLLLYFFGV